MIEACKLNKSLSKHHCYCPMLLMQTSKTAVLFTKANLYHCDRFLVSFKPVVMSNTSPIALIRLLEWISNDCYFSFKNDLYDHYHTFWFPLMVKVFTITDISVSLLPTGSEEKGV